MDRPPGMTLLEAAAGTPIGLGPASALPETTLTPLQALEAAVDEAVRRPPCHVAFSGGQDSSLVLAAAARAAARAAAPPPVAVTLRFPAHDRTNEDHWQALVLEHLGLGEQVVIEVGNDLDLVGPAATAELLRRGVVYPANAHSLAPLVEAAAGGTLLVGLGGDELLAGHRWTRLNDVLARRRRPTPRDAVRGAVGALPGRLRGPVLARRFVKLPSWLRPDAARRMRTALREEANEPVRFDLSVEHAARVRTPVVVREGLARLGGAATSVEAPLLDPRFVSALARAGGGRGFGDRVAVMHAVAGSALPVALLDRRDKARFEGVFFGERARRFAETWSGEGVDEDLVDHAELRRTWLEPWPDFRSALLLQLAWRSRHGATP
jgi:asparagine synthase (glutamine-hydrolysing)